MLLETSHLMLLHLTTIDIPSLKPQLLTKQENRLFAVVAVTQNCDTFTHNEDSWRQIQLFFVCVGVVYFLPLVVDEPS